MNHIDYFEQCEKNSTRIAHTSTRYGLMVEEHEDHFVMCHMDTSFAVKKNNIESSLPLRVGLWATFSFENQEDERFCDNIEPELKCDHPIKNVKVGDQTDFPDVYVRGKLVGIISKVAAPISDFKLRPFGNKWRYCAWSTEWGRIGDPKLKFARWSKDFIHYGMLEYSPGLQPVPPYWPYLWRLKKIMNCKDLGLQKLILRSPWHTADTHDDFMDLPKKSTRGVPKLLAPVCSISTYNDWKSVAYVATKDGRRLELSIDPSELKKGLVHPGCLVLYVEGTDRETGEPVANFVRYPGSRRPLECEVQQVNAKSQSEPSEGPPDGFHNDRNIEEIMIAQFKIPVTMELKGKIAKEPSFEVFDDELGKLFVDVSILQAGLRNCARFNSSAASLIPGHVIVVLASFVNYKYGYNKFHWVADSVKKVDKSALEQ